MQYLPANKIADKFPSNVTEDFIKLLCDQGRIDHSRIPSHDGRKSDVYMIPECEINTIRMLLYGDDIVAEKEKEEEKEVNTVAQAEPKKAEEYYSTDDVMKMFGFKNKQRVYSMASYRHIKRVNDKGYPKSEIDAAKENYITRQESKEQNKPSEAIVAVDDLVDNNDDILALEKRIKEQIEEINKWKRTVYDLKLANEKLKEMKMTAKPDMTEWKAAYKEGFFDCIKFANTAKEFLS